MYLCTGIISCIILTFSFEPYRFREMWDILIPLETTRTLLSDNVVGFFSKEIQSADQEQKVANRGGTKNANDFLDRFR
jgi:hypothetical protein